MKDDVCEADADRICSTQIPANVSCCESQAKVLGCASEPSSRSGVVSSSMIPILAPAADMGHLISDLEHENIRRREDDVHGSSGRQRWAAPNILADRQQSHLSCELDNDMHIGTQRCNVEHDPRQHIVFATC